MDWPVATPTAMAILSAVAGYLIGAVSFARIVTRIVAPGTTVTSFDLQTGAANTPSTRQIASATAVGMKVGKRYGKLAGAADVLKILLPALFFRIAWPDQPYFMLCAIGGMIGHIWPVYYHFRGGRGLSAAVGGMLAVSPLGVLVCWVLGIVLGFALRSVFLIYFGALWLFIPWIWWRTHNLAYVLFAVIVNGIFVVGMIPEIKLIARDYREGKQLSFEESMQVTPMSQQMYKMALQLRLIRQR
jgi:acyl phosphate:glycerol-3-phosphate acyltransferase